MTNIFILKEIMWIDLVFTLTLETLFGFLITAYFFSTSVWGKLIKVRVRHSKQSKVLLILPSSFAGTRLSNISMSSKVDEKQYILYL